MVPMDNETGKRVGIADKSGRDKGYDLVLDRMRGLCSRREYCASDIRQKVLRMLQSGNVSISARTDADEVAESVINSLVSDSYLSDLRYSIAFARDKSSLSGWGTTKIRYALAAKGIDSETISSALAEIDADKASDRLAKLLAVKYKSLLSSAGRSSFPALDDASAAYQLRQKLVRFALGRGYSYDDISSAIDALMKGR